MSGCHPQANLTRITMTSQTEEFCCGVFCLLRERVTRSPVSSHIIAKVAHTGGLWPSSSRSLLNNCLYAHLPAAATLVSTRRIVRRDLAKFALRGKINFYLLGKQFCKMVSVWPHMYFCGEAMNRNICQTWRACRYGLGKYSTLS